MTRATQGLGRQGEALAEQFLVQRGACVLARNHRTPFGELDLVVEHDGDLVGVEVKTRVVGQPARPEESVDAAKLARLERLLQQFAQATGYEHAGWRIDVVAIQAESDGRILQLEHIRDAYG